ncbi:RxLR effector protein [Phytophthora megakarya]|uniref:RxLR effector protein n=1 Tax=Phytophthora megakarya TaxID=4795 RepID=A0A225VCX5_9STRA|nr:RxLR effector protein [Phytophthora megakarya]
MAGSSVSWCSNKQGSISLSTAEAELIALSEGAKENVWLWHLLREMGFSQENRRAAISTVKNLSNDKSMKISFLFTRDLVEERRLEIQYCSTSDMAADTLTKPFPAGQFIKLRELFWVKNLKTTGDT